jgi:hypothetical protein
MSPQVELSAWQAVGSVNRVVTEKGELLLAVPLVGIPSDEPSFTWPYPSGNRRSKTVFIRDLRDAELVATRPIPVALEFMEGQVTACCYDVEQFGVGEDEFSALDDLRATLVELYHTLRAEKSLGPLPQRQLAYLKRVLRQA